ncbi:uncharacterized protein LOC133930052 isoform X2 [Phragmites australis]|uniref:uncharacterized protein LOC133930052 isoform X2 n=2 Tax=Phragmites australis TaxID=29695 RepID=UPI002D772109|nr:uncharacterized protein LOC133930052 isoform X2 [Phragmites australis]
MDAIHLGTDVTYNVSTESHYGFSKAIKSTYTLKGQQITMIGRGHPTQHGAYVMDSPFNRDVDRQSSLMEQDDMIQLNNYMLDDSSHVGQRCQRLGCNEVVESQTVFCKSHTVGQRCQMLGCPHTVPDGSALCTSHGGGHPCGEPSSNAVACTKSEVSIKYERDSGFRETGNAGNALSSTEINSLDGEVVKCKHQGCSKRAQGNTMYCKVHNGVSKRCMVQGCTKGAHGGTPLCISHGGGKRCVVTGCPNAACGSSQGRTDRCVRHGGGRRCNYDGCGKGAQGNTDFCIAHGGGRRCKYEECGKSAQGRTDYCIKHGGGRRCKLQGCSTSAKWGMDFCSVHRKSLLSANSADEMLPTPPPKRCAKKAKRTVEAPGPSMESATMSAIPGCGMPNMAIAHAAGSDHDKLLESLMMKHACVVLQQPPQSSTKSSPPGLTLSTEGEATARSRELFGL